jgi:hypothetical protein
MRICGASFLYKVVDLILRAATKKIAVADIGDAVAEQLFLKKLHKYGCGSAFNTELQMRT